MQALPGLDGRGELARLEPRDGPLDLREEFALPDKPEVAAPARLGAGGILERHIGEVRSLLQLGVDVLGARAKLGALFR